MTSQTQTTSSRFARRLVPARARFLLFGPTRGQPYRSCFSPLSSFAVRIPRFSSFVLRLSPKSFLILTLTSSRLYRIDIDPIRILISDKNQIFLSYDFRLIVSLRNAITRSRSFPVSRASYFPHFNRIRPLFLVPFVAPRFLFLHSILVVVRKNFL